MPYTSVTDYLHQLRAIAQALRPVGPHALFYMCAAVSDFFIPRSAMVRARPLRTARAACADWRRQTEHKIQSSTDHLTLTMYPVPKMLSSLRCEWAPDAMVASFKVPALPAAAAGGSRTHARRARARACSSA